MTLQRAIAPQVDAWLRPELLPSLAELNGQFIDLLAFHAATPSAAASHPLLEELRPLLLALDPAARRRVACCPYLLMDAGFGDPQRWLWAHGYAVREEGPAPPGLHLNAPRGIALARQVFAYAWHLVRSHRTAARIALGMSARTAEILANSTLGQTMGLADAHPEWLQPRWPRHARMWRDLLEGAARGEGPGLEQARMRGVQLLAAEARSSALP